MSVYFTKLHFYLCTRTIIPSVELPFGRELDTTLVFGPSEGGPSMRRKNIIHMYVSTYIAEAQQIEGKKIRESECKLLLMDGLANNFDLIS